jgi:hypothetical protein
MAGVIANEKSGYDGSLMGSINATPNYTKYYNLPPEGNAGTGIVFAIFNVRLNIHGFMCARY